MVHNIGWRRQTFWQQRIRAQSDSLMTYMSSSCRIHVASNYISPVNPCNSRHSVIIWRHHVLHGFLTSYNYSAGMGKLQCWHAIHSYLVNLLVGGGIRSKDLEPFVKATYRTLEPFRHHDPSSVIHIQGNRSNPLIGTFIQQRFQILCGLTPLKYVDIRVHIFWGG